MNTNAPTAATGHRDYRGTYESCGPHANLPGGWLQEIWWATLLSERVLLLELKSASFLLATSKIEELYARCRSAGRCGVLELDLVPAVSVG